VGATVNPLWDNVCMTAGSVVSNRQARAQTLAVLKEVTRVNSSGMHGDKAKKVLKKVAVAR